MPINPGEQDPLQMPLEIDGMPEAAGQRFDPAQRRAFGSVPTLLGAKLEVPKFEHLDGRALQRVTPENLRSGLGLVSDNSKPHHRYSVDGLVLGADEYTAIVRSPGAFANAVQAKTIAAGKASNDVRLQEKEIKSGYESFRQKWDRQNKVLSGLGTERATLRTLLEWQRVPGYSRSSEVDIVVLASQALNGTFRGMLKTLKDSHQLPADDLVDMDNALAYRLFRGPQKERVKNWGGMLLVADNYVGAKINLFSSRQHEVERRGLQLRNQLHDFNEKHDILQLT